jgi:hypothetical protein
MSTKRIIVDEAAWTLPDDHPDSLLDDIASAFAAGSALRVDVLDDEGRRVSLLLNGRVVRTVVVDLGVAGRPTEISGGEYPDDPDTGDSGTTD